MTDPKTAAILQAITAEIRPCGIRIADELNADGLLEFALYVKSETAGTDTFTLLINVETAFDIAEKLVLPFARKML